MDSEQGLSQINNSRKVGSNLPAIRTVVTEAKRKIDQGNLAKPVAPNSETLSQINSEAPEWLFQEEPVMLEEIARFKDQEETINSSRLHELRNEISAQILVGKRAANQREIEEQLATTFGLSFSERMQFIRPIIFRGITTKYGEKYDENINNIRTRDLVEDWGLQTAENTAMREVFFPQFEKQIDILYTDIKKLPEEQQPEASLRFVSYLFTTGIMLHPYIDGNGQTFKMLVLSYIHELGGEALKQKYFPKKHGKEKSLNDDPLPTRIAIEEEPIYELGLSSGEAKLLGRYNMLRNRLSLSRQRLNGVQEAEKVENSINVEFQDNREKMEIAARKFSAKQNELHLSAFTPTLKKKATAYLDFITNSQQGQNFIKDFILRGSQQETQENDIFNPYKKRTIQILTGIQNNVEKLPELDAA